MKSQYIIKIKNGEEIIFFDNRTSSIWKYKKGEVLLLQEDTNFQVSENQNEGRIFYVCFEFPIFLDINITDKEKKDIEQKLDESLDFLNFWCPSEYHLIIDFHVNGEVLTNPKSVLFLYNYFTEKFTKLWMSDCSRENLVKIISLLPKNVLSDWNKNFTDKENIEFLNNFLLRKDFLTSFLTKDCFWNQDYIKENKSIFNILFLEKYLSKSSKLELLNIKKRSFSINIIINFSEIDPEYILLLKEIHPITIYIKYEGTFDYNDSKKLKGKLKEIKELNIEIVFLLVISEKISLFLVEIIDFLYLNQVDYIQFIFPQVKSLVDFIKFKKNLIYAYQKYVYFLFSKMKENDYSLLQIMEGDFVYQVISRLSIRKKLYADKQKWITIYDKGIPFSFCDIGGKSLIPNSFRKVYVGEIKSKKCSRCKFFCLCSGVEWATSRIDFNFQCKVRKSIIKNVIRMKSDFSPYLTVML